VVDCIIYLITYWKRNTKKKRDTKAVESSDRLQGHSKNVIINLAGPQISTRMAINKKFGGKSQRGWNPSQDAEVAKCYLYIYLPC